MTLLQLLVVGHVAVFGIWFGTDVATFIMSGRVLDPSIDVAVRSGLAGVMMSVEVIARLCLPTMLALGLSLSIRGGLLDVSTSWVPIIWIATLGWLSLIWAVHRSDGSSPVDATMANVDLVVRTAICISLYIAGIWSVASGDGPFTGDWLGLKVVLFAVIMTSGIVIRFLLRPFGAAFAALVTEGSSPEREARLRASLQRAQPLVGVIWFSILASVILGVTRALPWS